MQRRAAHKLVQLVGQQALQHATRVGSWSCNRAASTAGASAAALPFSAQDKIVMKGMTFHAYHGVLPEVRHRIALGTS
jgi:hypothetical protein